MCNFATPATSVYAPVEQIPPAQLRWELLHIPVPTKEDRRRRKALLQYAARRRREALKEYNMEQRRGLQKQ